MGAFFLCLHTYGVNEGKLWRVDSEDDLQCVTICDQQIRILRFTYVDLSVTQ